MKKQYKKLKKKENFEPERNLILKIKVHSACHAPVRHFSKIKLARNEIIKYCTAGRKKVRIFVAFN